MRDRKERRKGSGGGVGLIFPSEGGQKGGGGGGEEGELQDLGFCESFFDEEGGNDGFTCLRATDLKQDSFGWGKEEEERGGGGGEGERGGRRVGRGFSDFGEWEGSDSFLVDREEYREEREDVLVGKGYRAARVRGGLFGGEIEEEKRKVSEEKGKEEEEEEEEEEEDDEEEKEAEDKEEGVFLMESESRSSVETSPSGGRRGRSMSGFKEKVKKSPLFRSVNWK